MLRKRRFRKEHVVRVTFALPADTAGADVCLMGDFNAWQDTQPLKRHRDGSWRVTLDLEPDREYEFRYLVDGSYWLNDPEADDFRVNPYGEENSIVMT